MASSYPQLAGLAQRGAQLCIALLLLLVAVDTLIAPTGGRQPNPVVWFALSLPLLIFIPGVWRGGLYSFAWLSFVSLLYFAQAVTVLFTPLWRGLDILHLAASVMLFVCSLFFVRWRARADRAAE